MKQHPESDNVHVHIHIYLCEELFTNSIYRKYLLTYILVRMGDQRDLISGQSISRAQWKYKRGNVGIFFETFIELIFVNTYTTVS